METNTSSLNLEGGQGVLEKLRPQRPSDMWVILGYMTKQGMSPMDRLSDRRLLTICTWHIFTLSF